MWYVLSILCSRIEDIKLEKEREKKIVWENNKMDAFI